MTGHQRPSTIGPHPKSAEEKGSFFRSIFRHGWDDTPTNRLQAILGNFWLHLHPTRIPRQALRFHFTWCAGGITFLLFLATVVSGFVLVFHYRPHPAYAYRDIIRLGQEVSFGSFWRSIHRYAGDGMVIMVMVHTVRVILTGSYKPPREFNWVIGVILLVLTLAIAFTGYLLPWDQKGYWATTVGTQLIAATPIIGAEGPGTIVQADRDLRTALVGGVNIGSSTLLRFYAFHCFVLPLIASLLMALHFWRVRKDGISGPL